MDLKTYAKRVLTALSHDNPGKSVEQLKNTAVETVSDDTTAAPADVRAAVDSAAEEIIAKPSRPMTLAIDFDGTLVEKVEYPEVGADLPGAVDTLRKLIDKGWKPFIFSSRAWSEQGKRQIQQWLNERGFNGVKIVAKPFATRYIDDLNVPFDGNWAAVERNLSGQTLIKEESLARRLEAGLCTMREFCEESGFQYDEFKRDAASLSAHDPSTFSRLAGKYNIRVSPVEFFAAVDRLEVLKAAAATYLRRAAKNELVTGDHVIDSKTGQEGRILDLSEGMARVASLERTWTASCGSLLLRPAAATKPETAGIFIAASQHYPAGLHREAVRRYYSDNLHHFLSFARGRRLFGVYATAAGTRNGEPVRIASHEDLDKLSGEGLVELRMAPEPVSDVSWLEVCKTGKTGPGGVSGGLMNIIDSVDSSQSLADVSVIGSDGEHFIIMLKLNKPENFSQTNDALIHALQEVSEPGLTVEVAPEPGMPCPGSVDALNGCIFEKKDLKAVSSVRTIC